MRTFQGRVVVPGQCKGPAIVTKTGFNILATFQKSLMDADGTCVSHDINNKELYLRSIKGEILCIPQAVGSTTAGFMIQSVAAAGIQPKAMLFSRKAESLVLAGILVSDIWEDAQIITVDDLGEEFLNSVKDGDMIEVSVDGKVTIY